MDIQGACPEHGIHGRLCWRDFYRSDVPQYWFHENLKAPNERAHAARRRLLLVAMARQAARLR